MRFIKCKIFGDTNNRDCWKCFRLQKTNKEFQENFKTQFSTKAECVRSNAEYLSDSFIPIEEKPKKIVQEEPFVEFLEALIEMGDGNLCFELEDELWVSVRGLRGYFRAIKYIIKKLKKVGFHQIGRKLAEEYELEGIWFKREKFNNYA